MDSKRVMIVDPKLYSRMVLTEILRTHGYSVCFEASNIDDAIANYEKAQPDLVLVEARMPGKDGASAVRELCAKFHGCQVVLCATAGQRRQVCEALSAGAVDFIGKPFSERGVVRTLRRIGAKRLQS